MPIPETARVACTSPQFVEQATSTELGDWLSYFDPAAVFLTGSSSASRTVSTLRRYLESESVLFHPRNNTSVSGPHTVDGVQFVFAPTLQVLSEIYTYEQSVLDTATPTYIISGLLDLDVDTTTLSTSLLGREDYVATLTQDQLAGDYIHISTQLPAGYRREWNRLTVVGGGTDAGTGETPLIALDCQTNGRVLTHSLQRKRLGIRAIDGVGYQRARQLREAGYTSRESIAGENPSTLAEIQGIGKTTAEKIQTSARALDQGEIVRNSQTPLPSREPIYIDIETDGLSPTITWLIGVLDGSADDGEYFSFVQTNPDIPGKAIEEFMAWYTEHASHRPIVAYNGWSFDFEVLHDHIVEYCPQYEVDWTNSYRFDPYQWAVKEENATLPGRTNQLEDVAAALGYEGTETGLTGAGVARAYQQWMADQSPDTELDWNRFIDYCEDDVRALAVIYEEIDASGRVISTDEPSNDRHKTTTQGKLSDW